MNRDAQPDIDVAFTGSSGFTVDDAEAVRRRLSSHFGPRYQVNTEIRDYDLPPGLPIPPDVIVSISNYVISNLANIGLGVLSNALYDAFKKAASRSQGRSRRPPAKLTVEVFEKDNESTRMIRIEGSAESFESLESIGKLLEQAQDRSKRELADD